MIQISHLSPDNVHKDLEQHLINIRRHLHQYPELSNEEYNTTKSVRSWLEEAGIDLLPTKLETGVFAEIKGDQPGPQIAIRADIDALPIKEETNLPYASQIDGKMHACGHDFHTAAVIGAAILLKRKQSELKGTVRFLFQPAEEIGNGARKVIQDGKLNGTDVIIGLHNKPDLPVGTIGIKDEAIMAAVDRFKVKVTGKGSHAALPHNGRDPIAAFSQMAVMLQQIVSRRVSPLESAVVSVTKVNGGSTWNVIPGELTFEGTVRTFSVNIRNEVKEEFDRIIRSAGGGFSLQTEISWYEGPPPLKGSSQVAEVLRKTAGQLAFHVVDPEPSMAGEDFAHYLEWVPGAFVFFGTGGTEDWHHPSFTLDENAILKAAEFLSESAVALLQENFKKQQAEESIR